MADKLIKWFDLSRFGAALKVVPNSPLRGIAMTCFDVQDPVVFQAHVQEALAGNNEQWTQGWWDAMAKLGFGREGELYRRKDDDSLKAYRVFSQQATFTLAQLREVVPGIEQGDMREMTVGEIVYKPEVSSEMSGVWKDFTQNVLAREAVGVWIPKVNPYDRPYADARKISEVITEHVGGGSNRLLDGSAVGRWYLNRMDTWNYRENALCVFYADKGSAIAAGYAEDQLQEATLPYALPLLVGQSGNVIALRDIRYAHELLALSPVSVLGDVGETGVVMPFLREAPAVALAYGREYEQWTQWAASEAGAPRSALEQSLRRAVEADFELVERYACADSYFVRELADGNVSKSFAKGGVPMKSLEEWKASTFAHVAGRVKAYGVASAEDVAAVLVKLDERARDVEAKNAKRDAQAALTRVAKKVKAVEPESTSDKVRHEDVGEKIGGARKDYSRRAMNRDDLEHLNELERQSLVVKKNVWAPLDYEAMRERGVTPEAAVAIKYLKDLLASEPDRRHSKSGSPDEDYIDAIGLVRDRLADVKTVPEFTAVCFALSEYGRGDTNYIYGGSPFQVQIGSKAAHLLADSHRNLGYRPEDGREPYLASRVAIEIRRKVREHAPWDKLIKPKREKTDAEREQLSERNAQIKELHRPHLDHVKRIGGQDWRGGRDVIGQELLDHFGFRGIEFGNWLPNSERQEVLNMAFDSMCDLADALDLPPRAVSFNGKLAVAFGARGTGGVGAALAHFEPARMVINLTRMSGAGALAHEWLHGNDWWMGGFSAFATKAEQSRFTEDPLPGLVQRMMRRAPTQDEVLEKSKALSEKHKRYATSWVGTKSMESRHKIEAVAQELFEAARASMYTIALSKLVPEDGSKPKLGGVAIASFEYDELGDNFVETLMRACEEKPNRKARDQMEANTASMLRNMAWWVTVEAAKDSGVTLDQERLSQVHPVDTDFLKQAQVLDETRSDQYWSTAIEMFARAGEQYVFYKLRDKGVRSDYLVHGVEEARYSEHPIGDPYPGHEDRIALEPYFDAVIEDFRKRMLRAMELDVEEMETPEP